MAEHPLLRPVLVTAVFFNLGWFVLQAVYVVYAVARLGRVSAVIVTATFGARPLDALLGAALAARWGLEACLWVSSAGFAAQFLILAASPVPRLRRQPEGVAG